MNEPFRPRINPARCIYDALMGETEHRNRREVDEWIQAERQVVLAVSQEYARQHGLRIPTMDDVLEAERYGEGHVDYVAKVAYRMRDFMQEDLR